MSTAQQQSPVDSLPAAIDTLSLANQQSHPPSSASTHNPHRPRTSSSNAQNIPSTASPALNRRSSASSYYTNPTKSVASPMRSNSISHMQSSSSSMMYSPIPSGSSGAVNNLSSAYTAASQEHHHGLGLLLEGSRPGSPGMSASSTMVPSHSQVSVPPIVTLMKTIESLRPVTDDEFVPKDAQELLDMLPKVYDAITNYMLCFPESYVDFWNILKPVVKHVKQHSTTHSTPNLPPPNLKNFPKPPEAPAKRITFTNFHGEEWHDDYKWLHDREDPAVLEYIQKENEYTTTCLAPTAPLQKLLYKEFISRIDENEQSAHVTLPDGYSYYSRKVQGEEYRQHCRINVETGVEEVYLDENEIAALPEFAEATFFRVGFLRHSPCGRFIAFGIDDSGNERYKVFFKDLRKMECFDRLESVWEDFEFSNDGNYVYYLLLDDYERAYKIMRHKVGSGDQTSDVELYEEVDEMFYLTLTKSCNSRYVFFNASAQITSETRYIDLEEEAETEVETIDEATGEKVKKTITGKGVAPLRVVFPRREGIQYTVENHEGFFYILTNEGSKNNWLFRVPVPTREHYELVHGQPAPDNITLAELPTPFELLSIRETVIPPRDFVLIEDFQIRVRHLVVFERSNCIQNVRIVDLTDPSLESYHYISFSESVYSLWPMSVNEEVADLSKQTLFNTNILRYTYTSLIQPKQIVDYNMDTREFSVVHTERVVGPIPYTPELYASRRLFATGEDGTAVPISIVYRKDLLGLGENKPNPLLLHGYGAYAHCVNPIFSTQRLSLLDRGFIYAVAHVRGGADMGMGWYEEGKLGKKVNTFNDFIRCMEYLIKEGYTSPSQLAIYGRSAGGLLIGAVYNMRPDLFCSALTEVPFVDVVNTMFDSSIPWTAFEYEEWGNPEDKNIYEAMKSYCPYTNIKEINYPHLMVVGGMNDPRVAFFEPLKFVAKLRKFKQGDNLLLLRVDDAGHGGNSGLYSYLEDLASEYAFLIYTLESSFKPIPPLTATIRHAQYHMDPEELYSYIASPASLSTPMLSPRTRRPLNITNRDGRDGVDGNGSVGRRGHRKEGSIGVNMVYDDDVPREYRSAGKKGDRGMSRVYQWLANFF